MMAFANCHACTRGLQGGRASKGDCCSRSAVSTIPGPGRSLRHRRRRAVRLYRSAVFAMSGWGLGVDFDKLSKLAETAAQTAAAVRADAEAKLVASLNADNSPAAQEKNGVEGQGKERAESQQGEAGCADFSAMSRKDLEELCSRRSDKLKQAVQKIRAQQQEYSRVLRDYEQLQEIVRLDTKVAGSDADKQLAQAKLDLKDSREHTTILKEQLAGKDSVIAELKRQVQQLQASTGPSNTDASAGGPCCESVRAELESLRIKLEQAEVAASCAEASGKDSLRKAQAEHAAALEEADKRAAEQLSRAQDEHLQVLQLRQQLENLMNQGRDQEPAQQNFAPSHSFACSEVELMELRAGKAKLEKENEELNSKYESTKDKFEKLKAKSQEMLTRFKAQTVEKEEKQKELEGFFLTVPVLVSLRPTYRGEDLLFVII
jgi:hypothetical protein